LLSVNKTVEIEVNCEKGSLKIVDGKLFVLKDGINALAANDIDEVPKFKDYWGSSHKKLIERFYKSSLGNDKSGYMSYEDEIMSVELINGIYESSAFNKKVELKIKIKTEV
jgi:UDP-N-acetyl-2-amino-2-deoxyglucuronate dehydrogenase